MEAREAWHQPDFFVLIISEPHSHVLSPAFGTTDDPSWQQSLKTIWAHTQTTLEASAQSIPPKKKQTPFFTPNQPPPDLSLQLPNTLGCNNKRGVKNTLFSFKSSANFPFSNLFSLLSQPASTTSRTLPWNVRWEVPRFAPRARQGRVSALLRATGLF